ncbi:hypothetical protein AVEN_262152-1 [Araneus ventricosus]|uniref:Uncharacterized protein n=1 Tax=Araneus ventricosus TaxID=182803 RepID=A0A4Y2EHV7_ARAVE|nr:hypothetical protein AVEN_262152-1 [Araneus ventricosus]
MEKERNSLRGRIVKRSKRTMHFQVRKGAKIRSFGLRVQMTWETPELATTLHASVPHKGKDVRPTKFDLACNWPTYISSGIGFRTWSPPAPKLRTYH